MVIVLGPSDLHAPLKPFIFNKLEYIPNGPRCVVLRGQTLRFMVVYY